MSLTYEALQADYIDLWDRMEMKPSMAKSVDWAAAKILAGRARYEAVSDKTGVPWFVIGLLHLMESGADFSKHLHNGDPLTKKTINVPKGRPSGRGPWTWEDSAIDAVVYDKLDKVTQWPLPRIAYCIENFNGWGYRQYHPEVANPYLWSGCTHYARGKYVEDPPGSKTRWAPNLESKQVGAMPVLRRLAEMVPELGFVSSSAKPKPEPPTPTTPDSFQKARPAPVAEALKGRTVWAQLIALFGLILTWLGQQAQAVVDIGLGAVAQLTKMEGIAKLAPSTKYVTAGMTVAAILIAIYARIDDAKGGKR